MGDTRHSSIHGLGDDCMHGIKAELCKHAEAEDSLLGTKGRFLPTVTGGGGLSLEGIGLGATG